MIMKEFIFSCNIDNANRSEKCSYESTYVYVGINTRDDMKPGDPNWARRLFNVNKVVLHPKYNETESTLTDDDMNPYDIAMIRLDRSVNFTRVNDYYKINTICLPQEYDTQEKDEMAQVMGWGLVDNIDNNAVEGERLQMGYMNVKKAFNDVDDYHGKIMVLARTNNESAILCQVSIIMKF